MSVLLLLIPLALTGRAIFTGGIYAPIDIAYQTDPLRSLRGGFGIGDPARAVLGDVVDQDIPWRKAIRESVKHGRLPAWNRFILGGEPLLAAMQSAVLHPFTWIGMLLPLDQAWTLEMSLGVLLALLSAFLLLSDLELSDGAALLGAIAWAFCDYLRFYAGWALSPAAAVFPLLLLGLRRIVSRRARSGTAVMIAALALCVVAGHPETALHAVCGGGIWLLVSLARSPHGSRWRVVGEALLAGIAAACLTAVLILPHLEALHQTFEYFVRSSWWVHQHKGSTLLESLSTMRQAILPYAFGVAGRGNTTAGSQVPQAYLGAVVLPLASIGLLSPRREKWAAVALAVVGFGAWSHFPILTDAIASLPLLDMALNERLVFLGCFAVALLAALGAERLLTAPRPRFIAWVAAAWVAVIAVLYGSSLARLTSLAMPKDFRIFLGLAQLIPLLLVGIIWAVPSRWPASRRLAATAVLLLGQRVGETWHFYPVAPRAAFYPHLELLDPIPRGAPYRMAAIGMAFIPNVSTMYEVEDVRGYDPMTSLALHDTYPLWCVHQPVFFNRIDDAARPFLSFLNVKYVLAAPDDPTPPGWRVLASTSGGRLVQNPNALERAFIPHEVLAQPDAVPRLAAMAAIPDFARRGLLDAWPGKPSGAWLPNGDGRLSIAAYRGDFLGLDIRADRELVVGTSIPAWKGWVARLDGSPIPLLRYNHAFLGATVPPGHHSLELRYRPASLLIGAILSLATGGMLLAFFLRRPRQNGVPADSGRLSDRNQYKKPTTDH